jgi:hypothetical protein
MEIIGNQKYNKLKLSQEEKDIFFDFVNLLPKGIYDKSNKIDCQFMEAMKCGETKKAFDYLCQLSWNQIALKILTYATKQKTYSSLEDKDIILQDFNKFVANQHSSSSPQKIIICPRCNDLIMNSKTCSTCGAVIEDE